METMRKIPVVFSIDRNVVMPFVVSVTSLLESARPDTFYEIFVLCNAAGLDDAMREKARCVERLSERCSLTFVDVREAFASAYEIRGITIASYYRLLMPDLFPMYDRMIYADVDMIFRDDLSDLYAEACTGGELVAGVREMNEFLQGEDCQRVNDYLLSIGCDLQTYINGGFLVMNLQAMREEGLVPRFLEHAGKQYIYQDQDIINIVCRGRIELLPMRWNYTYSHYMWSHVGPAAASFREAYRPQIEAAERSGTFHYSGPKPWKSFCPRYDFWWVSYRRSPVFDPEEYFRAQDAICAMLARAGQRPKPSKWKRFRRSLCKAVGFKKSYWQ